MTAIDKDYIDFKGLKSQVLMYMLGLALTGAGATITFYFHTLTRLEKLEESNRRLEIDIQKKADMESIESLKQDIKEIKDGQQAFFKILIEKR